MLLQIFAHVKQHHKSMNSEEAGSILVNVVLRREESSSTTAMQILQEVYPEGHSIKALCAEIEDLGAGNNEPKDTKAEKIIQLTADRDSLQAELIQARQSGTAGSGKKEVGLQLMQRLFDHWHSQNQQLFFMTWKDFKVDEQTQSKQKFKALKKVMQSLMSSETGRAFKNFHKQFSAGVAEQLRVGDVQTIQSELDEIKASEGFANAVLLLETQAKCRVTEEKLEAAMKEWTMIKDRNIELEHQLRKLTAEPKRSTFAKKFVEMKNQLGVVDVEAADEAAPTAEGGDIP